MALCASCHIQTNKLHKLQIKTKISWVCTACNSGVSNGRQLGRRSSLTRTGLLMQIASLIGKLASSKGRTDLLNKIKLQ